MRARAQKVIVENGAARGVEAITWEGHRVTVRSRAVVSSAGALHTPALLKRSGLANAAIGKGLCVQPALAAFGVLDRELRPWEGTMQAIHVSEFRDLDGQGIEQVALGVDHHHRVGDRKEAHRREVRAVDPPRHVAVCLSAQWGFHICVAEPAFDAQR